MLQYLILPLAFLSLYSCGGGRVAPRIPDADPPRAATYKAEPVPALSPDRLLQEAVESIKSGQADSALKILQQVTERYPDTAAYKRALFFRERALILMDNEAGADAAMLRVEAEYPLLADYAVFILAEYHFSKERYTQSATLYQRVTERYPKSSLVPRAVYQRAQALLKSQAYHQAIAVFERFLREYPRAELVPDAFLGLGRALIAEDRLAEAVRKYQEVWVKYPGSAFDLAVEEALEDLEAAGVEIPELTSEELYERGKNLYRSNQYEKAMETFAELLEREPRSPYRSDVLFKTGIAAFNTGKRGEAAAILEKVVKAYPSDARTPEALLWIGRSYSKLGDWERGEKTFQKILDSYPWSDWADDALFFMGNIYRETGDMKKALAYYGRLAAEYPGSKFADSAIWWKAWTSYTAGDFKKAEKTLQELINRYPKSFLVKQARYWQGKIAEKQGDLSRALAYYERLREKGPYTYYGYRATERMAALSVSGVVEKTDLPPDLIIQCEEGTCPEDPAQPNDADDGPPVWTEETKALLAAEPSFKKTLELMHLDMKKEASIELWSLHEKLPRKRGALIGLSKAFFELGDFYRSLMIVLRNYERYLEAPLSKTPEDLWLLAYPQAYWESIIAYSRKYGQDPYFIAAIMREESQFNTEALSPAGARGLMQVMPSTGSQVAQMIKMRGFDGGKLFDADTAINIGTWYIGLLMKRFKGDPYFASAAYNAGPEAVSSWLAKNGNSRDRDTFVESIPYMETRGYVKKVLRNYAEYKRIYGKTGTLPAALDQRPPDSVGAAKEQYAEAGARNAK